MTVHLISAVEHLKKQLLSLAALTEDQLQRAVSALKDKNQALAEEVIFRDSEVDKLEVDLEEECLKILALYQPVAHDLRFVVAVLKINNDLERIGDYGVNVAERALVLSRHTLPETPIDVSSMAANAREILKLSIDCLIKADLNIADEVFRIEQEIDEQHKGHFERVQESIMRHPASAHLFIQLLSVSRYLERVSDLAVNIAEDVIYIVEGRIIRHQRLSRKR